LRGRSEPHSKEKGRTKGSSYQALNRKLRRHNATAIKDKFLIEDCSPIKHQDEEVTPNATEWQLPCFRGEALTAENRSLTTVNSKPIYFCHRCAKQFRKGNAQKSCVAHLRQRCYRSREFRCRYPGCSRAFVRRYQLKKHNSHGHREEHDWENQTLGDSVTEERNYALGCGCCEAQPFTTSEKFIRHFLAHCKVGCIEISWDKLTQVTNLLKLDGLRETWTDIERELQRRSRTLHTASSFLEWAIFEHHGYDDIIKTFEGDTSMQSHENYIIHARTELRKIFHAYETRHSAPVPGRLTVRENGAASILLQHEMRAERTTDHRHQSELILHTYKRITTTSPSELPIFDSTESRYYTHNEAIRKHPPSPQQSLQPWRLRATSPDVPTFVVIPDSTRSLLTKSHDPPTNLTPTKAQVWHSYQKQTIDPRRLDWSQMCQQRFSGMR